LLAALERYKHDCGHYPPTLDKLVPTYLSALPQLPPPLPPAGYWPERRGDAEWYSLRITLRGQYDPWPAGSLHFAHLSHEGGEVPPDRSRDTKPDYRVGRWLYGPGSD
jgi:hypothetical protein